MLETACNQENRRECAATATTQCAATRAKRRADLVVENERCVGASEGRLGQLRARHWRNREERERACNKREAASGGTASECGGVLTSAGISNKQLGWRDQRMQQCKCFYNDPTQPAMRPAAKRGNRRMQAPRSAAALQARLGWLCAS